MTSILTFASLKTLNKMHSHNVLLSRGLAENQKKQKTKKNNFPEVLEFGVS